eukprot:CAMPEP_0194588830 /NCGR_PEP_ID=MMETSP0292-20121207/20116_1 /TAXON_ID=39354 /ORGANISM="Heterosigma akashiwo, Strain CCMP2393" /LENGTH=264 /DNA_ID=CAMNT_0039445613 /DNA_START=24 /DNA_END=819 /DNA_ORIENTATION=-
MTGRAHGRKDRNTAAIEQHAVFQPYRQPLSSGISVQELKNMTALRMAQQGDPQLSRSSQASIFKGPQQAMESQYHYEFPRLSREAARPEVHVSQYYIPNHPSACFPLYQEPTAPIASGVSFSTLPRAYSPNASGVSVQELKQLTKKRLARQKETSPSQNDLSVESFYPSNQQYSRQARLDSSQSSLSDAASLGGSSAGGGGGGGGAADPVRSAALLGPVLPAGAPGHRHRFPHQQHSRDDSDIPEQVAEFVLGADWASDEKIFS